MTKLDFIIKDIDFRENFIRIEVLHRDFNESITIKDYNEDRNYLTPFIFVTNLIELYGNADSLIKYPIFKAYINSIYSVDKDMKVVCKRLNNGK